MEIDGGGARVWRLPSPTPEPRQTLYVERPPTSSDVLQLDQSFQDPHPHSVLRVRVCAGWTALTLS